jgi:hypothetical protein
MISRSRWRSVAPASTGKLKDYGWLAFVGACAALVVIDTVRRVNRSRKPG